MPASFAHRRFGQDVFPSLPEENRRTIQRFRPLFDVGQHGPDLFFYFQPLYRSKTVELGYRYHEMSGKAFFEAAAARLRQSPSEGAEAYLYGVLGHYVLDSACHPLIRSTADEGKIGHTELETEFDRHLLTLDGVSLPHLQDLGKHARLTWGECVTVSEFYPPASAYAIRHSLWMMRVINRVLAMHNRELLETLLHPAGTTARESIMYPRPNRKCGHLIQPLCELYDQAKARYPGMAAQLTSCIREGNPLGTEFEVSFG